MGNSYYLDKYKAEFLSLYDRNSIEFHRELDRLLSVAKVVGAEREKYRILDRVRNKSYGIVVEAFGGDLKNLISLVGNELAKALEKEASHDSE